MLKCFQNIFVDVKLICSDTPLDYKIVGKISWSPVPGLIYITVPEEVQDKYMTVLKLHLDGPVKLYRGKGGLTE